MIKTKTTNFFWNFKFTRALLFFGIFLFFALSASSAYGEISSASYKIIEFTSGGGDQINSTNFSVTGSLGNSPNGSWSTNSLPLVAGTITSCGKITTSGTYTLGQNLTGISGPCFVVLANDVTIDGAGFSVSADVGNSNYAVMATSSVANGGSGYATTTVQNITFSGFAGGVNAKGNNSSTGVGGVGGSVVVSNATVGSITTAGGTGTATGAGGSVTLVGTNLDLSNNTYTSGTFSLSYSGNLITTNATLSALSHFIINSTDLGSYTGGAFPLIPGTINSCGTLYFPGTYTFNADSTGDCNVVNSGVVIVGTSTGIQKIITGNVSANNYGVTLSNISITGAVSTTGAGAGALNVIGASNLLGAVSVTGQINGDGSGSLGNTTINAGGSVATSSVSFVGSVVNSGTINGGISVAGKTTNNSIINTGAGSFTFNGTSSNSGTVNGNAILSTSSTNGGTITGNETLGAFTAVSGAVTFSGTTSFAGTGYVNGNIYDSASNQITSWIFNASSTNAGVLKGDVTFNDTSGNNGTILGNATFNNTSTNAGTITGNANVYSPVVRPLSGTIQGQLIYYGYAGLYFNDSATGHGVVGKWNDVLNWWSDVACTIHSPIIPTSGDNVTIVAGNIATSSITAAVNTITFQGTSGNGISLSLSSTSSSAALFNASSTNSGTIIGNATFSGSDTNNNGTVNGFITRQYDTGIFTVLTDFTHNSVNWIVQVINGARVDLSGATYNLFINTFQALNNGIFTAWNNTIGGGSSGSPSLAIASPVTGTNIKWTPSISWGTSNLCQYKIDAGNYTSLDCSKNGVDIPRPSATGTSTPHTMFFKSTDSHGNIAEKSVVFTYDNTQPVWTACGSDLLDEPTRQYYYLTSNVGNCSITASTTLRGDNNGGGSFFTVGNITGTGNGANISLTNVTATGTVSGLNNITVASSTLSGSIDVVGILTGDNKSTFGDTTVESVGTISGGAFVGTVLNKSGGIISNSTSSPVTVVGNVTNQGIINGDFIFNATSTNTGVVNGNLTLNASSTNTGTINGDLKFNTLASTNGVVTFSGTTAFSGTGHVTGSIKDISGNSITRWIFNDSSINSGFTIGSVFFNNSSTNFGTVSGNAYFNDSSISTGTVTGVANVYYSVAVPLIGTINGGKVYHSYPNAISFNNAVGDGNWNNPSNWFTDTTLAIPLGRTPSLNENVVLFASTTLPSDVTNNIFFAVNNVTLSGAEHKVTGNVSGNGAYGGNDAYNFNLENITVTGTTTAVGGDGFRGINNGGRGGTVNVATSSTGGVVVNGGDPLQNGGDAGEANITNSFAVVEGTRILAVGGASSGCGFGGDGGNISLINSSGYILVTATGEDATSTCGVVIPPQPTTRSGGRATTVGVYVSPATKAATEAAAAAAASVNNKASNGSAGSIFLPLLNLNTNIGNLNLSNLPSVNFGGLFGNNFGVSNLVNPLAGLFQLKVLAEPKKLPYFDLSTPIMNFLNSPLPKSLADLSKSVPSIKKSLTSADIRNGYDLFSMKDSPVVAPTLTQLAQDKATRPESLIFISVDGKEKETKLSIDKKGSIYQIITVEPYSVLSVSIKNTGKALPKATFNNANVTVTKDKSSIVKASITAPKDSGTYMLKIGDVTLQVKVEAPKPIAPSATSVTSAAQTTQKKLSPIQKLWSWFTK